MEEILHQLRLVAFPIIYKDLYLSGGAGFLPSTVYLVIERKGISQSFHSESAQLPSFRTLKNTWVESKKAKEQQNFISADG